MIGRALKLTTYITIPLGILAMIGGVVNRSGEPFLEGALIFLQGMLAQQYITEVNDGTE